MLLVIVTDTFVLQMVKQVLRNDTFNIAGWFIGRKGEKHPPSPLRSSQLSLADNRLAVVTDSPPETGGSTPKGGGGG
jgi:hypothetical protein